jgi:hypothetical protein
MSKSFKVLAKEDFSIFIDSGSDLRLDGISGSDWISGSDRISSLGGWEIIESYFIA